MLSRAVCLVTGTVRRIAEIIAVKNAEVRFIVSLNANANVIRVTRGASMPSFLEPSHAPRSWKALTRAAACAIKLFPGVGLVPEVRGCPAGHILAT
jgi:hypothetical protein